MMRKITRVAILLVLFVTLMLPRVAYARGIEIPSFEDKVVPGGTFTLRTGEVLDGSLLVLGGVVTIEEGALVKGDIVILGGSVTIDGEIDSSLIAIGGVVTLSDTVVIHGDLIAPASVVNREAGAVVEGQVITNGGPITIDIPDVPAVPNAPTIPNVPQSPSSGVFGSLFSPALEAMWFLVRSFAFAAIAVLMIIFVPSQTRRASDAFSKQPLIAGGIGLLATVIAVPLSIFFAITIILSPLSLLLILLIGLALLFGWVALGAYVGERLAGAFNQEWSQALEVGAGTFMLTFVIGSIGFVFWDIIGAMLAIALAMVGLGGVLLTRFGTREYSPTGGAVSAPPVIMEPEPDMVEIENPKRTRKKKEV